MIISSFYKSICHNVIWDVCIIEARKGVQGDMLIDVVPVVPCLYFSVLLNSQKRIANIDSEVFYYAFQEMGTESANFFFPYRFTEHYCMGAQQRVGSCVGPLYIISELGSGSAS